MARILKEKGATLEKARACKTIEEILAEVREGIDAKIPVLAIGGGDGTFSAVSKLVKGTSTTLGVCPLGTGNAFARDLGIPAVVETAAATILGGRVAQVDIGEVNGEPFVNLATIGLTTRIARNLNDDEKRRFGRFVYALALWRAFREVKPFVARLETNNGVREFETLQIVIGVGRYHAGPLPLSREANITDGRLTVYALQAASKLSFLKMALRLPFGRQGDLAEVHSEEAISGRIITDPQRSVTTDGEVQLKTPIEFRVVPRAIRVLVPPTFTG